MVLVPFSAGQAHAEQSNLSQSNPSPASGPSNLNQTRLSLSCNQLTLCYSAQFLQAAILEQGIVVALRISISDVDFRNDRELPDCLQSNSPECCTLLLNVTNPAAYFQFIPQILPLDYACFITDTSILALLQLLQTELQTPHGSNHLLTSSILQVLAIHLLRQWQAEPGQPTRANPTR